MRNQISTRNERSTVHRNQIEAERIEARERLIEANEFYFGEWVATFGGRVQEAIEELNRIQNEEDLYFFPMIDTEIYDYLIEYRNGKAVAVGFDSPMGEIEMIEEIKSDTLIGM